MNVAPSPPAPQVAMQVMEDLERHSIGGEGRGEGGQYLGVPLTQRR